MVGVGGSGIAGNSEGYQVYDGEANCDNSRTGSGSRGRMLVEANTVSVARQRRMIPVFAQATQLASTCWSSILTAMIFTGVSKSFHCMVYLRD